MQVNSLLYSMHSMSDTLLSEISSFMSIPVGWHYGEGVPADASTVNSTVNIYTLLKGYNLARFEVFPLISGDIMISGYTENDILDITARRDGLYNIEHEHNDVTVYELEGASFNEIQTYMAANKWQSSSDLFTHVISVTKEADLLVKRSTPHQTVYPLFRCDAQNLQVGQSVLMSQNIIHPEFLETQ